MYLLPLRTVMGKMLTTLIDLSREQTRNDYWFNIALISVLTVVFGTILFMLPLTLPQVIPIGSSIFAICFLLVGIVGAWQLLRTGRRRLAAITTITTLFAIPTYLNFVVYQTIHSPDVWVYFIIIPLTGLLLGRKYMLYFTLLCLSTVSVLFTMEYFSYIVPTATLRTEVDDWAILLISLSLNTVLLYITIRKAEDKTDEAERSVQTLKITNAQLEESRIALQHAHAELELRVQERTKALQSANQSLQTEMEVRQSLMDALRHSEANWRSLVQHAPELIATVALDGTILFVNRPIRDEDIEDLLGLPITHLHSTQEHRRNLQEAVEQVLATGQSVSYESDEEFGGNHTWAINRLGPIYHEGTISALILISTDISEQKQAEMAVLHSQKLESLGVMAGGVAHDFNNLLAAIIGQASLASQKVEKDSDATQEHLQNILLAGQRATDLTRQMLNYAGRSITDFQSLDLNRLLQENIQFFSASISKHIQLQGVQAPDLPRITADTGQLQQLIMNLILNAADAIGDQTGTITLSTQSYSLTSPEISEWKWTGQLLDPGIYAMLEITDTGCGMDVETLKKIFDPFFTTKFTGRGLGLASVIGIVRTHRGGLQVTSTPGVGTTFRILFPANADMSTIHKSPVGAADLELETAPIGTPKGMTENKRTNHLASDTREKTRDCTMFNEQFVSFAGKVVLIIDDEDDVRHVTAEILELSDIETLEASNGIRGLELFRQHMDEIDLVLLDLSMPGMSGEDVVKQLWAIQPDVTITLLSGYDQHEVTRRLGKENHLSFLQKPYSMDLLLQEIGQQFARAENAMVVEMQ